MALPYLAVTLRYQFSFISQQEVNAFRRTGLTVWSILIFNYGHHYLYG